MKEIIHQVTIMDYKISNYTGLLYGTCSFIYYGILLICGKIFMGIQKINCSLFIMQHFLCLNTYFQNSTFNGKPGRRAVLLTSANMAMFLHVWYKGDGCCPFARLQVSTPPPFFIMYILRICDGNGILNYCTDT